MTKIILLESLKRFSEEKTSDLLLPVRRQEEDESPPPPRSPSVFLMRLPDFRSATKKAPYMLHQIITGADVQPAGDPAPFASAVVRTVFCAYCEDEQEGSLHLLNMMERLRISLLETPKIDKQFELDLSAGLECMPYPDGPNAADRSAPYFLGEMLSTWKMPKIKRKDCNPWQKMQQPPMK